MAEQVSDHAIRDAGAVQAAGARGAQDLPRPSIDSDALEQRVPGVRQPRARQVTAAAVDEHRAIGDRHESAGDDRVPVAQERGNDGLGKGHRAPAAPGLWRGELVAAGAGVHQLVDDVQLAGIEVEIAPRQPELLALAEPGAERDEDVRLERVAIEREQDLRDLGIGQRCRLLALDLRRVDELAARDVALDEAGLHRLAQRTAQNGERETSRRRMLGQS